MHRFPTLQVRGSHAKYRSKILDDTLGSIFPEQHIVDLPPLDHPIRQSSKVAVLTSSATGRKVLFSNYRRKASSKRKRAFRVHRLHQLTYVHIVPYTLYPVTNYSSQPKVADMYVQERIVPGRLVLTFQSARASMAHTELFKPHIDPRLGQLYFKKDMTEGFLIEVAQNEYQAIYTGLEKEFPDVLLSLGCGKTKRPSAPSIASNDTKKTKASSRFTSRTEMDDNKSYFTEDSSDAYAHYPRPNFISLNPVLDDLPELDDISSIPELQSLIRDATDPDVVRKLVAQLFATLFYAETDSPVQDTAAGEVLIPGKSALTINQTTVSCLHLRSPHLLPSPRRDQRNPRSRQTAKNRRLPRL